MKVFTTTLALLLFLQIQVSAQCPPAGFPSPGFTCQTAPILCPTLDGYCVDTEIAPSVVPPVQIPGCGGGFVFNNPIWFAFFAGTATITMQITASNCMGGNNGIQAGIYDNCISQSMDLQCSCSSNFVLTANNFVPGEIYYFFIDGCSGADCDISIDVTAGSTEQQPPGNPGPITGPTVVCAGTTSTYSITPTPFTTSYNWTVTPANGTPSNSNASTNITWGNTPGTVEVCVETANQCLVNPNPSCKEVEIIERPTATISGSGVICGGANPDPVELSISFTGTGPWTFVYRKNGVNQPPITTSDNPYILSVTMAGTYTLGSVSTPPGSCTGTVSGTANVTNSTLSANIAASTATCGQSNGTVSLTPSGGNTPYSFEWSNGETTQNLTNVPGGTYTVTVTDDDGCTVTRQATVNNLVTQPGINGNITPNTACSSGNGAITLTITPAGSYTFEWSNGETTQNLTGLDPGTYVVTVTQVGTCTNTASFTVPDQPNVPTLTHTTVSSTCELPNGSINLSVSGGVSPYTYEWSSGETTQDLTNIPAGDYTVTVTGANGCTSTREVTVGNNNPPININGNATANTSCNGNGTGTINITVTPAGSYTFEWSNGSTSQNQTNLDPGSYTVTVSGGGACTNEATFTVPDLPNVPTLTHTQVNTTCELGNGSINLSVSGGVSPYTYEWSSGETTQDLSNIPAGDYTVTVTGANGCTSTREITIDNTNPPININGNATLNTSCNSNGTANITITVTPAGSYTFEWSNGATTQNLTGLQAGDYTVTVQGPGACTAEETFTVADQPNEPDLTYTTVNTTCDQSNGSINLSVSGGTTPYSYEWSSGQTTQDLTNIPAGNYTVTVTGSNGCTATAEAEVENDNPPININGNVVDNTACAFGTGSITISVSPAGSYTFSWSNGSASQNQTGLEPGDYTVTVQGPGSCTAEETFTVDNNPNEPNLTYSTVNTTCDLSNGSINLSVSGGTAPYTYQWSSGQTTQDLTNVPAGTYVVTVTAANGCTAEETIDIENDNPDINLNANITNNTSCANGNGAIQLFVSPAGSYTFEWSSGQTTQNINMLQPGDYTVTVQGPGSCTAEETFTVEDDPNLPELDLDPSEAMCDLPNGDINASVSGGTTPYTYIWSSGQTTQDLTNVLPGNYSLTVTAANGCTAEASTDIFNDNPFISVDADVQENTACVGGNGFIHITDVDPNGPATFLWSTGSSSANLNNLPPGDYTVTVSLGGSCTEEFNFTVEDNPNLPEISENVTEAFCGLSNGSIQLTVFGATMPYTYQWSSGQITKNITNVPSDSYEVTVTGANGCSAVSSFFVPDEQILIDINTNIVNNTSCTGGNGSIQIFVSPSTSTVLWDNGSTSKTRNGLQPGDYTVTVSAGGTCTQEFTITVEDESEAVELTIEDSPATCGVSNGSLNLTVENSTPPFTYIWSNNKTSQDIFDLEPGDYSVTVTSTLTGCTGESSATVFDNVESFSVTGAATPLTSCTAPNGAINLTVTPNNVYTYVWSNGKTTKNIVNLPAGTYTVTVTLGVTCSSSATFVVTDNAVAPNLSASGVPAICTLPNGSATATASGGVSPYTFTWSNMGNGQTITNVAPGTYSVTVSGNNGCTATATAVVANNNVAINISATPTDNTSCVAGNGALTTSISPANGTYTYLWSTAAATANITGLSAGNYTVTVSAGGTCTAAATFAVVNNTSNPVVTPAVTGAICNDPNGAIDLSISGAITPYTYAWSNMAATQDLSNILPGNYTVTVTGSNGCTATEIINVPNNSNLFALSGSATPLTRCDVSNGSVDLVITPATASYVTSWSGGQSTQDISSLAPGIYTVTVSLVGNSCTGSASFVVEDQTVFPTASASATAEICGLLNGAVDLTPAGGATPYAYKWSSGQTSQDLANIAAGNYLVTVTGANGCSATASANVPGNSISFALSGITTGNTSCLTPNGGINLSVSPSGTYTFSWSNGRTTEDLASILGGDYEVTVSAGGNCTNVASFVVGDNSAAPQASGTVQPSLCSKANGGINASASGGTAPYTFKWSNGPTTEDLSNILAGTYTVTVTESNGCSSTNSFIVPDNSFAPNISSTPTTNTACTFGNGAISTSVSPSDTYTYIWSGGQTTPSISGVFGGAYTVTVSAGGNCTSEATVNVPDDTDRPMISPDILPSLCSQPVGAINLTVTGSTTPYVFAWSNGKTTEDLAGLLAGTFDVTVTGANGCSSTGSYDVEIANNNFNTSGSSSANTFCIGGNGSINLTVTPSGVYTFKWSNGPTTEDINGLVPGTYTVTITDASLCAATADFTVADNAAKPEISGTDTDILCFGDANGAISTLITGGAPPFVFKWSPNLPGNPPNPTQLVPGTYDLTVTDANSCTGTASFEISQPSSALAIQCKSILTVSQPGFTDGKAEVTIAGGVAPYRVTWSPGSTQQDVPGGVFPLDNLGVGNYNVTVTDANGCVALCGFTIGLYNCTTAVGTMQSAPLSLCGTGCLTATYNANGQNLDPNDVFQFVLYAGASGQIQTEIARSNQPKFCFDAAKMTFGTTYYISAIAGNNDGTGNVNLANDWCAVISAGTPIAFYEKPQTTTNQPEPLTCLTAIVALNGTSTLPNTAFQWSTTGGNIVGNAAQASIQADKAGLYTLIINANGCLDTATTTVADLRNEPKATIFASPDDLLDCKIDEITLAGVIEGTLAPNTIWVSNGQIFANGSQVLITDPGTFQFVIIDTLSFCTDTAEITIGENLAFPTLSVNPFGQLTCEHPTVTLSGGSPFPGIQFKWGKIVGTDTIIVANGTTLTVSESGTYIFIGTDPVNKCTNSQTIVVIADESLPVADAGLPFSMRCFGDVRNLDGTGSTGQPGLRFLWTTIDGNISTGATTSTPQILEPGTYFLLVTNPGNGCTDTDEVVIAPIAPVAVPKIQQPVCFGEKGRIRVDSVVGGKPPFQYSLDNGATFTTQPVYTNLVPGIYAILIVDSEGCSASTTVEIIQPPLFELFLETEAAIKLGDSYLLKLQASTPPAELKWTPSDGLSCDTCLQTLAIPFATTRYDVVAQNDAGCEDRASVLLKVDRDLSVYVPNVFSPNGDGQNEVFYIFADPKQVVKIRSFQVFDRWGERVHEYFDFNPNDPASGWRGDFNGKIMNPAVFVWYAEIEFIDGRVKFYKGDVTLKQ